MQTNVHSRRNYKLPVAAQPKPDNNNRGVFGLSRDATQILCTVTDALREFPEARAAVAAALKQAREAREAREKQSL